MESCFVSITEDELFLINKIAVQDNSKQATIFSNKLFKDICFFYFLAINTLRMCSKCLVTNYEWATCRRSVKICENNCARYISRLDKYPPLFTSTSVNNCSLFTDGGTNHIPKKSLFTYFIYRRAQSRFRTM